eukprot:CAMPEP_0196813788 /NCGR_PEP_ID=MMETSP1362-20130617/39237_1 /TAXON_ID=163516 /ORGANISM="Leptocylindrus danicus, Strain CCMP1856" /LENGTH=578 /DNA_ID=CAMNT_0042190171 /DNA_START=40 /DNA_END=1776 /DNA_ORIENTATION=-
MTITNGIDKNGSSATSDTAQKTRHRNTAATTNISPLEMQPLPTEDYDDDDMEGLDESIDDILHRSGYVGYKGSDNDDDELDDEMIAKMAEDAVLYGSGHGKLHDWLFPPNVPRTVQLMRWENIAVPACYLLVGILQGLSGPLMNVYPLDLGATEAQQATISSLRGLPASFKLLFGFWSDNYLLFGYRRKSYMALGWLIASASMIVLLVFGSHDPSIPLLSFSFLSFGVGFWFADVMADSIVAEKAKHEPPETRGSLQSTCYACRFFGLMIAAPLSTVVYSFVGPNHVIFFMALFPLLILPLVYWFQERFNVTPRTTSEQCKEIWSTVCSRAVWQPMGFVYLYNLLQVGNVAWREFLKSVLGFTSNQLNSLLIVAYVLLYLGIMAYKYYFIHWSWRAVYIWTTLLNGVLSALQILLILGETFGIPPFWFALGDDAFADFIGGIQFLPTTIMMVHLCPTGSEGASYAMFTTVNNSALGLSSMISTMLLPIWDVSKETLIAGDMSGMINLTVLTTALQVSGIFFVFLLPKTKEDLIQLGHGASGRSRMGGIIFLSITFLSILYALVVGILNIVAPGWMGES